MPTCPHPPIDRMRAVGYTNYVSLIKHSLYKHMHNIFNDETTSEQRLQKVDRPSYGKDLIAGLAFVAFFYILAALLYTVIA